jgi:hypothetical protein
MKTLIGIAFRPIWVKVTVTGKENDFWMLTLELEMRYCNQTWVYSKLNISRPQL